MQNDILAYFGLPDVPAYYLMFTHVVRILSKKCLYIALHDPKLEIK
jgi:hypothetical protein